MTIDWWTLALEAINVVVLVWLLGHFFWKPVAAMLDERRAAAIRDLDAAAAKRMAADKLLHDIAATRAGLQKERENVLAAAAADADNERAARHARASKEIEALRKAAAASIAKEKDESAKALREQASSLSVDIAGRLLARLDCTAIRAAFLDGVIRQIGDMPEARRQELARNPLTLVSSSPLTDDETAECGKKLAVALGASPDLSFESDPKLVAGLTLQGSNAVIANNWREDLNRILLDLQHD